MRLTGASTPPAVEDPGHGELPVRRNILLLAGGMAALYGMVQLTTAVATVTFVSAGGSPALVGFAPAVFLAAAALAALPAGRAMDRRGRGPILALGFVAGLLGSSTAALGVFLAWVPAVVVGFLLIGVSTGTVMLSRAAAADMYPAERRPRAIATVLFGAVFGALLGPIVFIPLVSTGDLQGASLGPAWLGAAGFMAVGLVVITRLRPDPQAIAHALGTPESGESLGAQPLREIVRRPNVSTALSAAAVSWSAMVALMTLTGAALAGHGHGEGAIFPVLSAHFVGMFGLFLVVGRVIERIGRKPALAAGLVLLGVCALALIAVLQSVVLSALALFGIGLGWSLSYVAATAELIEHATSSERGNLLGLADLLAGLAGAALTVLGGYILTTQGLPAVSIGAAALTITCAIWILVSAKRT